jgi:hypothetical protein
MSAHPAPIAPDAEAILAAGKRNGLAAADKTIASSYDWPEPLPFRDERVELLRPNVLPGVLGEYAQALINFTETPAELATLTVLGVLSAASASKADVEAEPGYNEPLNIYVCPVLESGNRKTGVITHATRPLLTYEIRARERFASEIARAESERKTRLAVIDKLRRRVKDGDQGEIRRIAELDAGLPIVPQPPTVFTSDATAERLEVLLEANGGKVALISDEGGMFDIWAGRYNANPNLEIFLKGHCRAPVRVHRMGRVTVIDKPHLTILLSPQPSVLTRLKDFMRGRGLLARFLYALPQSTVGNRKLIPASMPSRISAQYEQLITTILEWQPSEPITLQLSSAGYLEWKEFQRTVETQMADGGRLCRLRDWGSKLPGAVLRVAGLLHIARYAEQSNSLSVLSVEIAESEIQVALEIGITLTSHAIAIFGMVSDDPVLRNAKRIMRWLLERKRAESDKEITKRTCFRAHYPHVFEKIEEMEPCLRILFDHHLIKIGASKVSRSPEIIEMNPGLKEVE